MSKQSVKQCLADRLPEDMTHGIVLFPRGDQTGCAWYGMSAEQVVKTLYQVADEIVGQRLTGQKH